MEKPYKHEELPKLKDVDAGAVRNVSYRYVIKPGGKCSACHAPASGGVKVYAAEPGPYVWYCDECCHRFAAAFASRPT